MSRDTLLSTLKSATSAEMDDRGEANHNTTVLIISTFRRETGSVVISERRFNFFLLFSGGGLLFRGFGLQFNAKYLSSVVSVTPKTHSMPIRFRRLATIHQRGTYTHNPYDKSDRLTRSANKRSAVAEMGGRMATTDMGRKVGADVPLSVYWGAGSPSNTISRPTSVPSGILDPHNRLATIHQRHRQTGQTDRQDSGPTAHRRTVTCNCRPKIEPLNALKIAALPLMIILIHQQMFDVSEVPETSYLP